MARGMVVGEAIVSQAQTKEFDEGYERVFGKDRKPQRGRWVWDEAQQKLVSADEYVPPARALDAPIMTGRFYENVQATDGTDIGSRTKHRDYMREHGLTTASDYTETWKRKQAEREQVRNGRMPSKSRREALGRRLYELDKP